MEHDFLKRFLLQGKLHSQIIAYIWRWSDDSDKCKANNAKELRSYFFGEDALEHQKVNASTVATLPKLLDLFKANPRKELTEGNISKESRLLIAVFGEERIKDSANYLSPMFSDSELGLIKSDGVHYKFYIDITAYTGRLSDPTLEDTRAFNYYISFPARPSITAANGLSYKVLEEWIDDPSEFNPKSPYIPFTT